MIRTMAVMIWLTIAATGCAQTAPYAQQYGGDGSPPYTFADENGNITVPSVTWTSNCLPQRDWKKAIWRVPLHIAGSLPVAAASLIVPVAGEKYVHWRERAETEDQTAHRDTSVKSMIDLYSQTAIVRAVLRVYGIRP